MRDYLQQKPAELAELYKDLLISVTSFFRDPDDLRSALSTTWNGVGRARQ